MLTKTTIALVVALVTCAAPVAMAQSHTRHSHVTHSYITTQQWLPAFGYVNTVPLYGPHWGWECVTDDGQGRFVPCDAGS